MDYLVARTPEQEFSIPHINVPRQFSPNTNGTEYVFKDFVLKFDSANFIKYKYGTDPAHYTYNGIDRSTFTNDNVKIVVKGRWYGYSKNFEMEYFYVPFSSLVWIDKDTVRVIVDKPLCLYQPAHVLEEGYSNGPYYGVKVFVGPGLKTLPGTNEAGETVPAYTFGLPGNYLGEERENFYLVVSKDFE